MLLDACVLMDLHVSKHIHCRLFSIADKEGPVVCTAASTLAHFVAKMADLVYQPGRVRAANAF